MMISSSDEKLLLAQFRIVLAITKFLDEIWEESTSILQGVSPADNVGETFLALFS